VSRHLLVLGATGQTSRQTGLPEAGVKARAALAALDAIGEPVPSTEDWPASRVDELRIWIAACTDPFGERAETVPYLHRIVGGPLTDMGKVGGAAWILDETELAVRVLRKALSRLRAPGVRGTSGAVLSVLVWAYIDSGRWNDALTVAREAGDVAAAYKMITVATSADLTVATVLAMRGDHDQAATILARVLAAVDTSEYLGCAARARHAAGLAAIAQDSYVTAHAQLSQLFTPDGTPLHHHFSYLAIVSTHPWGRYTPHVATQHTKRQRGRRGEHEDAYDPVADCLQVYPVRKFKRPARDLQLVRKKSGHQHGPDRERDDGGQSRHHDVVLHTTDRIGVRPAIDLGHEDPVQGVEEAHAGGKEGRHEQDGVPGQLGDGGSAREEEDRDLAGGVEAEAEEQPDEEHPPLAGHRPKQAAQEPCDKPAGVQPSFELVSVKLADLRGTPGSAKPG
jgi:hypothetical protein